MLSPTEKLIFFYFIPLIHVFFYVNTNLLQNIFSSDILYAAILVILSLYFFLNIYRKKKNGTITLLFTFSLLILLMGTFTYLKHEYFDIKTIKIILSNFFFVFGFFVVKTEEDFVMMLRGSFFTFILFVLNIFIYNYFGFGTASAYNVDVDFRFGGQGINTVQLLPFFILSSLFFFPRKECNKFYKIIIILLITYSSFLLVFSTKRGSLFAVILGFGYFFYKNKANLKVIFIVVFLLAGLFFLVNKYSNQIESVYEKREERVNFLADEKNLQEEGRYIELIMIINEFKRNPWGFFWGNGIGAEYFIRGNKRMIHTDFNMIFYSMGFLGLIIYILFFWSIIKKLLWFNKYSNYELKNTLVTMAFIMIIDLMFVGLSGSFNVIQNRSFSLFYVGSALGLLQSHTFYPQTK